jgi:hypothetical protein
MIEVLISICYGNMRLLLFLSLEKSKDFRLNYM